MGGKALVMRRILSCISYDYHVVVYARAVFLRDVAVYALCIGRKRLFFKHFCVTVFAYGKTQAKTPFVFSFFVTFSVAILLLLKARKIYFCQFLSCCLKTPKREKITEEDFKK